MSQIFLQARLIRISHVDVLSYLFFAGLIATTFLV